MQQSQYIITVQLAMPLASCELFWQVLASTVGMWAWLSCKGIEACFVVCSQCWCFCAILEVIDDCMPCEIDLSAFACIVRLLEHLVQRIVAPQTVLTRQADHLLCQAIASAMI